MIAVAVHVQIIDCSDEAGLPYAVTAVLHYGAVPQLLRLLLSNDCLQEVCGRDALYRSLYRLLEKLGGCCSAIGLQRPSCALSEHIFCLGLQICAAVRSSAANSGKQEQLSIIRVGQNAC